MTLKKTLAALLLFFILSPASLAFDIPEPDGFVTDLAGVFSSSEEGLIEDRIRLIEDNTTAEIGVLMLSTTEGEDISQLAFDVGNTWGVGKEENDNGLMILVAIDDRNWFMATGYGLEGALPDAITKRIAENHFPYYFRDSLYKDGIMAALDDVELFLEEDPSIIAEYSEPEPDLDSGSKSAGNVVGVFMALLFFAFAKGIWVSFSKRKMVVSLVSNVLILILGIALLTNLFLGITMFFSILMDLMAAAAASGGGGGGSSRGSSSSSSSGHDSSSYSSSSSSSGSSDSFGGGSFGGGGSGGSW